MTKWLGPWPQDHEAAGGIQRSRLAPSKAYPIIAYGLQLGPKFQMVTPTVGQCTKHSPVGNTEIQTAVVTQ